ncbi:response regulator transcription factor [Fusibacter paucivorans]|uniref:Stage 0 sporulation protein A homolog n=1 Tax=Fusibacter paucivorans TaxID=76009 RepID=A0ABS5PQ64_9FIRM|nr:response regulator transcription factor [Fusibacter paucivorans]MBS7527186.1 response regulator transcription factor [Fusibacter paucivorans]
MQNILIAEDEKRLREILGKYFMAQGFSVFEASDGFEALKIVENHEIDVVLMDIMMPKMDGFEATKQIRSISDALIIMLTARDDDEDKIKGLEIGADEYVTKPFSPKVIVARVNALLKRVAAGAETNQIIKSGQLSINRSKYTVTDGEDEVLLSPKEFELLSLLVQNKNNVMTRAHILDQIWGYDYYGDYRTVDTHIKKIRKKLTYSSDHIKTIVRVGYMYEVK